MAFATVTRKKQNMAHTVGDMVKPTKVSQKQIETIMANWNAYAWSIGCQDGDVGYVAVEQAFVFGAITQLLNCNVGQILISDLPPAAGVCLMSGRPLSSVWPRNPESVRLKGGR